MTVYLVASVGAVITLLVLALDPFVQQVVGTAQLVSYIDSDDTERQTQPAYLSFYNDGELREGNQSLNSDRTKVLDT